MACCTILTFCLFVLKKETFICLIYLSRLMWNAEKRGLLGVCKRKICGFFYVVSLGSKRRRVWQTPAPTVRVTCKVELLYWTAELNKCVLVNSINVFPPACIYCMVCDCDVAGEKHITSWSHSHRYRVWGMLQLHWQKDTESNNYLQVTHSIERERYKPSVWSHLYRSEPSGLYHKVLPVR